MASPRAFTVGGFVAGAVLAGIALSVHLLVSHAAMAAWAAGDWRIAVASVIPVGAVTGLAGAGLGWWVGTRVCPFHHGDRDA
jgi:hypothetical protein